MEDPNTTENPAPESPTTPAPETPSDATPSAGSPATGSTDPTPVPQGMLAGFVGEDGRFRKDWAMDLPEDLREFAGTFGKYQSEAELLKGFGHMSRLVGDRGNAVTLPNEKSTPEQIADFREKFGVPAEPDGYELNPPQDFPEELQWTRGEAGEFEAILHRHHVPKAAAQELANLHAAHMQSMFQEKTAEIEREQNAFLDSQIQELKQTHGAGYKLVIEQARALARARGLNPEEHPMFREASVVNAFAEMHRLLGEDKSNAVGQSLTTANPRTEGNRIITDSSHPLHKRYHEGDPEVQAMVRSYLS